MSDNRHKRNLPVPFFSQREVNYKWQLHRNGLPDIDSPKISLAAAICNIVSMGMLLHYYGITDDTPSQMLDKFFTIDNFRTPPSNQFFGVNNIPLDLRHVANGWQQLQHWGILQQFPRLAYGIPSSYIKQIPDMPLSDVEAQIKRGNPVMFSYGAVSGSGGARYSGHIAVIRGFTNNDHVIINDPWGEVGFPEGTLRNDNFGRFYAVQSDGQYSSAFTNLGNGDNGILTRAALYQNIRLLTGGSRVLWQAIYIDYPHIWSFPFHKLENNGNTTFRFSEPPPPLTEGEEAPSAQAKKENRRIYRENQVREMLRFETRRNAGFPISAQRLWHDGIHITGSNPVFAIGPGRIVAARIYPTYEFSEQSSNSFVLVRHRVRLNGVDKEFYSKYMHLAPVDISDRIRRKLAGETDSNWERDWFDQIIKRVMPMRAIWWSSGSAAGRPIPTFRENGEQFPVNAITRSSLFYLRPAPPHNCPNINSISQCNTATCAAERCVRRVLENITADDDLSINLSWFFNAVNRRDTYLHTNNHNRFAIYHRRENADNTFTWEIRYVNSENVSLQPINMPEFIYYRRALAKLLRGEVVEFIKEPARRVYSAGEVDIKQFLIDNIINFFPEQNIISALRAIANNAPSFTQIYDAAYPLIQQNYTSRISAIITNGNNIDAINREANDLVERIIAMGKILLSYTAEMFSNNPAAFGTGDQWIMRLVRNDNSVLAVILQLAFPDDNNIFSQLRDSIVTILTRSNRLNIDFFIEVNGNTKLGMPGRHNNIGNVVHFEIFSGRPKRERYSFILPADTAVSGGWNPAWQPEDRKFVKVEALNDKIDFFNARKITENLRAGNFHDLVNHLSNLEALTRSIGSRAMHSCHDNNNCISTQYAIIQHMHGHAILSDSSWDTVIASRRGIDNSLRHQRTREKFLSFKWFSKNFGKELEKGTNYSFLLNGKSWVIAVFYHPIRFLAYLDEAQIIDTGEPEDEHSHTNNNHPPSRNLPNRIRDGFNDFVHNAACTFNRIWNNIRRVFSGK